MKGGRSVDAANSILRVPYACLRVALRLACCETPAFTDLLTGLRVKPPRHRCPHKTNGMTSRPSRVTARLRCQEFARKNAPSHGFTGFYPWETSRAPSRPKTVSKSFISFRLRGTTLQATL